MPALLLGLALLQAAPLPAAEPDSVYATAKLRAVVERAAVENRRGPAALDGYLAHVESEVALVLYTAEGEEIVGQVEQIASRIRWGVDEAHRQRVIGHRVRAIGPNVSVLTYLRDGWLIPSLYGERFGLYAPAPEPSDSTRTRSRMLHPFGEDREAVYRFEGGDTVAVLALPDRTLRIQRIRVIPVRAPAERATLFHGEIDLDADRHQIVRMRGRLFAYAPSAGRRPRLLARTLRALAFIELENAEYEGRFWLPRRQRLEFQVMSTLADSRAIVRVVSDFRDLEAITEGWDTVMDAWDTIRLGTDPSGEADRPRLLFAPSDSISAFDDWARELGRATVGLTARDFDDVAPAALRRDGPPRIDLRVRRFSELIRYNRVEGLYTGAGAVLAFRDAAPGLELHGTGGWAWHAARPRASLELLRRRGPWHAAIGVGHDIAHTNDFVTSFEYHGASALAVLLAGADDYDYLERTTAAVTLERNLDGTGDTRARVETGWTRDRALERALRGVPLGGDTLRLNRAIVPGDYGFARLTLERNRSLVGFSLAPGFGARATLEHARGESSWTRLEAALIARRQAGPLTAAARVDLGLVLAEEPPPQTLYELGGATTLTGYEYKEFGGDRAALLRGVLRYHPGFFASPIRLGPVVLPPPAPAPAVQWQTGWTDASGSTIPALDALGSRPTGRARHSVGLHVTLFSALNLGVARSLDPGSRWRVGLSVGSPL